ncbi:MAG TPA: cadmium resistance transporter [Candidatus Limnocylindrales bacterium]|nr:cadmium resistance transporter [Candidatus Limnocylindrales bacterium]
MDWIFTTIITGIITFAATNVDDIFLLVLFFSQADPTFRRRYVVIGQYLGFTALIAVSLIGFLASLILPRTWIGLMGVIPILMGVDKLVHRKKNIQQVKLKHSESQPWRSSVFAGLLHHQAYNVATIKFANGSDNISIYTLLFASSNLAHLGVLLVVFFVLVGVYCYLTSHLARQFLVAQILTRYSRILLPYVMIGLGVRTLLENGTLTWFIP